MLRLSLSTHSSNAHKDGFGSGAANSVRVRGGAASPVRPRLWQYFCFSLFPPLLQGHLKASTFTHTQTCTHACTYTLPGTHSQTQTHAYMHGQYNTRSVQAISKLHVCWYDVMAVARAAPVPITSVICPVAEQVRCILFPLL